MHFHISPHVVVLLFFTPLLSGCVLTVGVWGDASASEMKYPSAVGMIAPDPKSGSRGAVVVEYHVQGNARTSFHPRVFVQVPVGDAPAVDKAVCIDAKGRTLSEILNAWDDKHLEALEQAPLQLSGLAGMTSPRVKGFVATEVVLHDKRSVDIPARLYDFQVVTMRQRSGRLENLKCRANEPMPEGALVLILPNTANRPPADGGVAAGIALCLTPLTLAGDAAVIPMLFLYVLFGGSLC